MRVAVAVKVQAAGEEAVRREIVDASQKFGRSLSKGRHQDRQREFVAAWLRSLGLYDVRLRVHFVPFGGVRLRLRPKRRGNQQTIRP